MFAKCATNQFKYIFYLLYCQPDSEENEEVFDSGKESVELFCIPAREKLTNSIRLQWRRLKSHVERLDSQGIFYTAHCHCLILTGFLSVFVHSTE